MPYGRHCVLHSGMASVFLTLSSFNCSLEPQVPESHCLSDITISGEPVHNRILDASPKPSSGLQMASPATQLLQQGLEKLEAVFESTLSLTPYIQSSACLLDLISKHILNLFTFLHPPLSAPVRSL